MKKAIFALFLLINGICSAQTTFVLQYVNGVLYKCTGVEGVQIGVDGTMTFIGGIICTEVQPSEFSEFGFSETSNNDDIAAKLACNTTTVYSCCVNGNHVQSAIFHQVCGPRTTTVLPNGTTTYGCMNSNSWLCGARIDLPNGFYIGFSDCN